MKNEETTTTTTEMLILKDIAATAVVAVSARTGGIGYQGQLPSWNLSSDLKHFAQLTKTPPPPLQLKKKKKTKNDNNDDNKPEETEEILLQNAVVMGRKTWESIPPNYRPLKGRTNVVISKTMADDKENFFNSNRNANNKGDNNNVLVASSLQDAWKQLSQLNDLGHVFVIGGAQLYQQAIEENYVQSVVVTKVQTPDDMKFDTYFTPTRVIGMKNVLKDETGDVGPVVDDDDDVEDDDDDDMMNMMKLGKWKLQKTWTDIMPKENELPFEIETWTRPNVEEEQYLKLIKQILKHGIVKGDRTGTGTKSIFGAQMKFDLRHGQLPLLTTKKVFWRGVAEELLWFIKGSTNAKLLQDKNIHIWDGNASKEFLEQRGLGHREEGDLGPVYGFQWRHFGAPYQDMHADYTDQGIDQLQECIDKIKNRPEDRRIIMTAWNPSALPEMALPPCHLMCQFYVDTTHNEVSCHMYQRSADMGLGVPFNIASYALLTHLIAKVTGRKPGFLVHSLGDAHVYLNHIEPLQKQLKRTPRPFPKLFIRDNDNGTAQNGGKKIDEFVYDDLDVIGYHPYPSIAMKMAV